jgi:RNA polymerase sigma-70 factor (ECF subfamily)
MCCSIEERAADGNTPSTNPASSTSAGHIMAVLAHMLGSTVVQGISAVVTRARIRFPGITCDDATLVDLITRNAEVPADQLSDEIVLTSACVAGDTAAIAELDRQYGTQLAALVTGIAGERADDIMQEVRAKLLTATTRAPRLAEYGGRGSLLSWLRVVAAREALSALRRNRRDVALDDDTMWGKLVASHDPALALIRAESVAMIKRAFAIAVTGLEVRERNLLRQHLLDGLTIDDLAPLYGAHRVTISRWLNAARESVWSATQKALRAELALTPSQVDSLLASARDYLDLSLERVL